MSRSSLVLATFALLALGVAAGAGAAEPSGILMAQQTARLVRGPGFYLNLFKFIPVLILFLLWASTTSWIDEDTRALNNNKFEMWNAVAVFSGVLGFALFWLVPFYIVGLFLLLAAWLTPLLVYVKARNENIEEERKVLTSYHLGQVVNRVMNKVGMRGSFNKKESEIPKHGPPIVFKPKPQGDAKVDPALVAQAEESEFFIPAKNLVFDAIVRRATDIHLEPTAEQLAVRYRIDGILHNAEPFDRSTGDALINIFKVLGALDINDRRKPQNGSFIAKLDNREIDFRIATSGSKAGEKMVMRVLDKANAVTKLDQIGLRPKLVEQVKTIINQPEGMFLVCGPAGTGKTTTLYACLREIDRFTRNVVSLEDLVEAPIENVNQIEISAKAGENVPDKLRSLIRQAPDVVAIGELRDQETATIACQAAEKLFVFSTVHANDTVTAIFRLLDLGVDASALASTLSGLISQRLVRTLCENCKEAYKPKPEYLKKANLPADKIDVFYQVPTQPQEQVCPACGGVGYIGRTGIFELLVITDPIRDLIRVSPSINAIKAEARKNGMIYLQEDGLRQVIQGKTSIKEMLSSVKEMSSVK